jgi:uncharacterized RDD family membrane protein YckC
METSPQTATFGLRLAAGIVDFIVIASLVFLLGKACSLSQVASMFLVVPLALVGFLYSFIAHARFGRTLGKYLLRIKVVRLDGANIGWDRSLRRSSVDGIFGLIWASGLLYSTVHLPAESFQGQGWGALYKLLLPLFPAYVVTMLFVSQFWPWSEFVTMLLNRQRRAIHDFIGSTRVIRMAPNNRLERSRVASSVGQGESR